MKYTRLILTFVMSSLFISSVKLEAMEELQCTRKKHPYGRLGQPQVNGKNSTRNRLENLTTNPPRLPFELVSHHNSANPVWKKQSTNHKRRKKISHKLRKPRLEYHQNSTSDKLENSNNHPSWLSNLINSSLDNLCNFQKRRSRCQKKQFDPQESEKTKSVEHSINALSIKKNKKRLNTMKSLLPQYCNSILSSNAMLEELISETNKQSTCS